MAFIFLCFKVMSYINVPPDRKKEKEVEPNYIIQLASKL